MNFETRYDEELSDDEGRNPFGQFSNEYVEKREKLYERARDKPRLTVRQQQIKKDNEVWENNRLARSGSLFVLFFKVICFFRCCGVR